MGTGPTHVQILHRRPVLTPARERPVSKELRQIYAYLHDIPLNHGRVVPLQIQGAHYVPAQNILWAHIRGPLPHSLQNTVSYLLLYRIPPGGTTGLQVVGLIMIEIESVLALRSTGGITVGGHYQQRHLRIRNSIPVLVEQRQEFIHGTRTQLYHGRFIHIPAHSVFRSFIEGYRLVHSREGAVLYATHLVLETSGQLIGSHHLQEELLHIDIGDNGLLGQNFCTILENDSLGLAAHRFDRLHWAGELYRASVVLYAGCQRFGQAARATFWPRHSPGMT